MSYIIGTSIQWGFDPRITFAELTETTYLFFRIACHSLWPISHLHIIPLERCAFLYALVTNAPIIFPHLFLCSLNEVHKSSSTAYALFHPVFIDRILLFLGLDDFPASEPIHIIAPIGATFLRQRVVHIRGSSKHSRVEPSGTVPLPLLQVLLPVKRLLILLVLLLLFLDHLLWMTLTFVVRWRLSWPFMRLMVRFWWTCLMSSMLWEQIWCLFDVRLHHLLLMMVSNCPLAFRHKKREYTCKGFL